MSGKKIPEEIVDYIFKFAFYPHEYPIEKYMTYNKCMKKLPKVVKSHTFIRHPIFSYPCIHFRHHMIFFNTKIYIQQCEIYKNNYCLQE